MGIVLNGQQAEALKLLQKFWKNDSRQLFELAGLAGTGKTTIISYLIESLGLKKSEVLFTSFTGKAVQLLNMKGNFAKTIHSTFYHLVNVPKLDEDEHPITINGRPITEPRFVKRDSIPSNIKLIVIDEAGMVGKRLAIDILSFGVKVIALGDLFQLPPVMDQQYFLKNPDYSLTQLMRQEEDSPVVYLSQRIIHDKYIEYGSYGRDCIVIEPSQVTDKLLMDSDIILSATNEVRDNINHHIKYDILDKKTEYPYYDDKLICRQNDWNRFIDDDIYLINGLIGYVEDIHKETLTKSSISIDFKPDFTIDQFVNVPLDLKYFKSNYLQRKNYGRTFATKFELAYAITVHLSQGAEYNKVLYFMNKVGNLTYQKKLDYTAITRSKKKLVLVRKKPIYRVFF